MESRKEITPRKYLILPCHPLITKAFNRCPSSKRPINHCGYSSNWYLLPHQRLAIDLHQMGKPTLAHILKSKRSKHANCLSAAKRTERGRFPVLCFRPRKRWIVLVRKSAHSDYKNESSRKSIIKYPDRVYH
jgi:hypothetical protein